MYRTVSFLFNWLLYNLVNAKVISRVVIEIVMESMRGEIINPITTLLPQIFFYFPLYIDRV